MAVHPPLNKSAKPAFNIINCYFNINPVLQEWVMRLSLMQQSVLLANVRGPDGVEKHHAVKPLIRFFRRSILLSAFDKKALDNPCHPGGGSFTGPSCDSIGCETQPNHWVGQMDYHVGNFLNARDELHLHYYMHFVHAVEIIGYKHPDTVVREFWHSVYKRAVEALHLNVETEEQMDQRLGDDESQWLARTDKAEVEKYNDRPRGADRQPEEEAIGLHSVPSPREMAKILDNIPYTQSTRLAPPDLSVSLPPQEVSRQEVGEMMQTYVTGEHHKNYLVSLIESVVNNILEQRRLQENKIEQTNTIINTSHLLGITSPEEMVEVFKKTGEEIDKVTKGIDVKKIIDRSSSPKIPEKPELQYSIEGYTALLPPKPQLDPQLSAPKFDVVTENGFPPAGQPSKKQLNIFLTSGLLLAVILVSSVVASYY